MQRNVVIFKLMSCVINFVWIWKCFFVIIQHHYCGFPLYSFRLHFVFKHASKLRFHCSKCITHFVEMHRHKLWIIFRISSFPIFFLFYCPYVSQKNRFNSKCNLTIFFFRSPSLDGITPEIMKRVHERKVKRKLTMKSLNAMKQR